MIDKHKEWDNGVDILVIDNYIFNFKEKRLIVKCASHNEALDIAQILSLASMSKGAKNANRVSKLPKKNKVKRVQKKRPRKKY